MRSAWVLLSLVVGIFCKEPVGQNLIVILIDGYGASLLNNTKPESTFGFKHLSDNGIQAEYLRSTFPTHSWPNWMSLVTGLHTESHGFTADYMWDENTNLAFSRGYGPNDTEDIWWQDRPAPLWYTAGKRGVDVHCYWFAHCHRTFGDAVVQVPMSRWTDLSQPDQTDNLADIFPEIVSRISRYQAYKQQLFLIRYAALDNAIRQNGPGSDEAEAAQSRIDLHIHDLQKSLEDAELLSSTNLVVLSDHGLAQVDNEEQFFLEECLADYSKVKKIVNNGAMLMVYTEPEDEDNIYFELKVCDQWAPMGDYEDSETPIVSVYRNADLPEKYNWKNSRFMSGIVLITKPGVTIFTRELPSIPVEKAETTASKAFSGWEPEAQDMKGIFMARGPAFKANEKYGPVDIVDVYQIFLNILGVEPAHGHNGTWSVVEQMLAEGWEDRPNSEQMNMSSELSFFAVIFLAIVALFL